DWYTSRSRFNSQAPLEFAYAAWNDLPAPEPEIADEMADYRVATPDLLRRFHARRLEAMEHVAADFRGNRQTELSRFDLPDLANFQQKATTFAQALDEFVTIERHVELAGWKSARLASPEQRLLSGETLIVRYVEEDQAPGIAEQNRYNEARRQLQAKYKTAYQEANPDKNRIQLSKEQKEASGWKQDDLVFRLRIETEHVRCSLDEALRLSTLKEGGRFVLYRRHTVDERLPEAERTPFTPTPKQLLWGMRAELKHLDIIRENGRAVQAWAEVSILPGGGSGSRGFLFGTIDARPLVPGELYTLDDDPNDVNGFWASKITEGLIAGGENRLYALMTAAERPDLPLPAASIEGQQRFLAGLDALHEAGAWHGFEQSKRRFIGEYGASPLLLVQGPPGTGKSYSTAFALLARIQGSMAADRPFRVFLSCKTHAATDVLLHNLRDAQEKLARVARLQPGIFGQHFDARLLDVPLYRLRPRGDVQPGIIPLPKDSEREKGTPRAWDTIEASKWDVVASTPGGIYGLVKERWPKELFGQHLAHCLVLDEASQMNIPEAVMAALPLAADGTVIVVGDHRQMPPIVKNDWNNEARRTFQDFKSYESLFLALLPLATGLIQFEESFRLHADMAEFLRKEIYVKDGIRYHSNKHDLIDELPDGDSFVDAVLSSRHPLTVVVHDEAGSQLANPYEQDLMVPILAALAEPTGHNLSPDEGLGVVVPHRAQRAALVQGIRAVSI
ncbi:MAG: AAA family ATPase, partial [Chloroflexota bacterium]|nr:AAA family ATPase [Chloroflexota bacterium]